ncbi:28S ribosomal protein S11, mitochondrial [Cimex lectularius]|uniref:Mitochondrial ribosomal protein S11 n=1 Tax=Cimex lectularius TaxID=79782 RepID=A0A8I6TBG8_CIMLE|nr:28S ribosomal protein S11, mitochondrial [Cimex lectularius]
MIDPEVETVALPSLPLSDKLQAGNKQGSDTMFVLTRIARNLPKFLPQMSICRQEAYIGSRSIHTSCTFNRKEDVRASLPPIDDGTEGEKSINVDAIIQTRDDMFPTGNTMNVLFNGIPFSQVPICNIRVSRNNTIFTMTEAKTGEVKLIRSCGIEGFKNTRKGSNVAAQATAITFGTNAVRKGYGTIRVRIQGLGPGRMSAIKGLQMAGLNIISITDSTPVSWWPPRPRKQRRL